MTKFKIGDKVRAQKHAPYGITSDGWVGEVIEVLYSTNIVVTNFKDFGSEGVVVDSQFFDKISEEEYSKAKEIEQ